jgi:hypothetical protein
MITINESFTEDEFKLLKEKKGEMIWHDFIMLLTQYESSSEDSE